MLKDYALDKPTLETPRLVLRPLTSDDVDDLRLWLGDDRIYTYWGRKASPAERDPALLFVDPRPWVKRKPSLDFRFGVALKESGHVIGQVEIFDIENNRMGSVGYRYHPDCWGKGIATEALRSVVDFIYAHTEMDRLHATADVRNLASNRVLEKCGFHHEGCIRHGKMVSVYCDYNIWGLLREDWEVTAHDL